MVIPVNLDADGGDEELLLLTERNNGGDRSWRLNFDGFEFSEQAEKKKPPSGLHDCLGVLGKSHYIFF